MEQIANVAIGTSAPDCNMSVKGNAITGGAYSDWIAPTNGLAVERHLGIDTNTLRGLVKVITYSTGATARKDLYVNG